MTKKRKRRPRHTARANRHQPPRKSARAPSGDARALQVPKLCGADIELGNFILGARSTGRTDFEAARMLLREIDGLPLIERYRAPSGRDDAYNPQDWGRRYLPANGGCAYIDLNHLELCLPEVLSAYDHVAAWHAMLRIAGRAQQAANDKLTSGQKVQVLVNNSDGRGNSYGSHLDFLITRRAWDNLFYRKVQQALYLAAFQVSSIIFTGQGKVGSENNTPPVRYQISQRADFFETLVGTQTTFNRPIINSRDEALCGQEHRADRKDTAASRLARLHVIFFDSTLAQTASLLKVGVMQVILAMLEAERVNTRLILDDPVGAVQAWSRDLTLATRARMMDGKRLTAIELQLLFLEEAKRFVARGGCDGVVPRAAEIIALWEDTLLKLQEGDFDALAPRLDWVLKLSILERAIGQRPDLQWGSPQMKHLDHVYSSLDPADGLYWAYEKSGFVERVVSETEVEHFVSNPPEDTRAWTRAMVLRAVESDVVDDVNWDFIRFKTYHGYRRIYHRVDLANPLAFTRAAIESRIAHAETLDELLEALDAQIEVPSANTSSARAGSMMSIAPMSLADFPGAAYMRWRNENERDPDPFDE